MEKTRLRIRFTKCGDLRWIGHRDLARVWERLLRRAGLELAFSQGFHPKPKISFPSALALGIEALDEVVELEILGTFELSDIEARIKAQMPTGMELLNIQIRDDSLGKAKVLGASYRVAVPIDARAAVSQQIDDILGQNELSCDRAGKLITCRTDNEHFGLKLSDGHLHFSIPNDAQGALRPSEMLDLVGLPDLLDSGAVLQRTQVHLRVPEPSSAPASISN